MKKLKGFTLIELLVVIAIIGILSAIVLVSLGGARSKAQDARIQADMYQIRSIAETLFDGDYDDVSTADSEIAILANDIDIQNGNKTNLIILKPSSPADKYCAVAELNNYGKWCCVDSQLRAKCDYAGRPNTCTEGNSLTYACE